MKGAGLSAVQRRWGMRQEGPCYVGGYYFQPSGQKSKKMMPEWKRKQERKIVSPKQWPRSCKEWSRLNMVLFSKAYGPNTTILFELFKTFNYTDITKKKKDENCRNRHQRLGESVSLRLIWERHLCCTGWRAACV